jgi:hypothetical protein
LRAGAFFLVLPEKLFYHSIVPNFDEMKEYLAMLVTQEQSRAALALKQSPIPPLRRLSLEEANDTVIIHGKVSTYYMKQLAQETIIPVLEGRRLLNQVTVVRELVIAPA